MPGKLIAALTFLLPLIYSCKKQAAEIPSYISIRNYSFSGETAQGGSSASIADAWVYIDDETVGGFEIPAKFPVLKNGYRIVKIKPGVLLNGNETIRAAYPFYSWHIDTVNLIAGAVTEIKPSFEYLPGVSFGLIEDFENSAAIKFTPTSKSDTTFNSVGAPDAYEGNYSASINLTSDRPLFEVKSFNTYNYKSGSPVFMELNCKTNYVFTVGIVANYSSGNTYQQSVLSIYPDGTADQKWRKLYINLSPAFASYAGAENFHIFIGAVFTGGTTEPRILIDNVKLVGI